MIVALLIMLVLLLGTAALLFYSVERQAAR